MLAARVGFGLATLASTAVLLAAPAQPPVARTVNVADDTFGLHLIDPYRWMEGEDNVEFTTWLKAQGAYGRAQLDAQPRLRYWQDTLGTAARGGFLNRLQQPMGGRLFYLHLAAGAEGVLMVRDPNGQERTLLDPRAHVPGAPPSDITGFSPSADGKRVAVNVQTGGGEISQIEVLNVDTAAATSDRVTDVWGEFQASWLPDGSGFTYTQMAPREQRDPKDPMLNMRVRLHRLGAAAAADPVLVARGSDARIPLQPHELPVLDVAQDSSYAQLVIGGARPETRLCLAERAAVLHGSAQWNCAIGYDDNVQETALHPNHLYTTTMKGHPNGELGVQEVSGPGTLGSRSEVLAEDEAAVITGLAAASDGLYIRRMHGGPDELLRVPYAKGASQPLALPHSGAIYIISTDPRAAGVVFTLQSWTQPRAAFRASASEPKPVDLHLGAESPKDYSDITAEEVTATSMDGTEVPLTIIHRRDAKLPLDQTAIVEGYGGYGISSQPFFDPFTLEWVQAGHVYAIAHVRGGGEKGDRWRVAGSGAAKERGVEDFIACAESLVKRGWAARGRVVAFGGSMGGVLVGGAITRRPEDFAGAAIQSGELNPSRLLAAKNGANQFAEVGDPRTEAGLKSVAAMDPYQRLKPGTRYPAVLLVVGINDNRVAPWNSGKFGARLLAASASGKPVWFRTDNDMGHFNTAQAALSRELADIFTFAELVTSEPPRPAH
jgi:prolyl oligopeptidase